MKSSNKPDDLIEIGKIVGAHGIHGAIRVYSYAESPACYTDLGDLIVIDPLGYRRHFKAIWAKPHKNILRLALETIDSRTAAEELTGWRIFIPRACLPPLEDETYYWVDLIGMDVYDMDDDHLGTVVHIIQTGANDVYVVQAGEGDPADEILIPAITSVVIDIDLQLRRMRVDLPDGLIESAGG